MDFSLQVGFSGADTWCALRGPGNPFCDHAGPAAAGCLELRPPDKRRRLANSHIITAVLSGFYPNFGLRLIASHWRRNLKNLARSALGPNGLNRTVIPVLATRTMDIARHVQERAEIGSKRDGSHCAAAKGQLQAVVYEKAAKGQLQAVVLRR
jgi:hypothetical protein